MYVPVNGMAGIRRRGMGAAGPLYTCPTGEQVFLSADCPGGQPPPDVQKQIADVWDSIFSMTPATVVPAVAASPFSLSSGMMIGLAAGFVGLILVMKAGR